MAKSFKSVHAQAASLIARKTRLGTPKSKNSPYIHSQRTAYLYQTALKTFGNWLKYQADIPIIRATKQHAIAFLTMKQKNGISQKTLDTYRLAIQKALDIPIERLTASKPYRKKPRAIHPKLVRKLIHYAKDPIPPKSAILVESERDKNNIPQSATSTPKQPKNAILVESGRASSGSPAPSLAASSRHSSAFPPRFLHPSIHPDKLHGDPLICAILLAFACGLRSSELLSILPESQRPRSRARPLSPQIFAGRSGELYTVIGKGGLVRPVMVPFNLAFRLESIALQQPEILYIQGVRFVSYYFIPGGPFFSQWFGPWARTVTKTKMTFHSLRHAFAQQRLFKLAQLGFDHKTAMTIVSQEMGHFRPEITTTYMKLK